MSRKFSHIYQIINETNQKSYIGKTTKNIEKYIKNHFRAKESKKFLHRAIRKYGKEKFSWKILWSGFATHDHLNYLELFFIAYYNTFKGIGYNCTPGGDGAAFGQDNPFSKTNMSKEKRKEMDQRAANTRKERGTNITGALKTAKTRIKNNSYYSGQKHPCSKTNMPKEKRKEKGQRAANTRKKLYNLTELAQKTVKTRIENNTNSGWKWSEESKRNHRNYFKNNPNPILIGKDSPHAKLFIFISPQNIKYKVFGEFKIFCNQQKLYFIKMRKNINKGKIKPPKTITTLSHKYTNNCTGREVIKM